MSSATDGGENPDFYYRTSRGLAKKIGLVDSVEDDASFTRGEAVEIFWRALSTKLKDSDKTLADRLIDQKVFDAKGIRHRFRLFETGNPESEGREENKKPDTSDNTNNSGNNGSTDNSGNNGNNGGSTTPPSGKLEDTTWEQYLAMRVRTSSMSSTRSLTRPKRSTSGKRRPRQHMMITRT